MLLPIVRTPLVFYRSATGAEPVLDWLRELAPVDRQAVGRDLMRAQWRWPVGMPLARAMGSGLHEVRSTLPSGTIARVFICLHGGALYALHGIIKKTQTTPPAELKIARRRQKEVEDGAQ